MCRVVLVIVSVLAARVLVILGRRKSESTSSFPSHAPTPLPTHTLAHSLRIHSLFRMIQLLFLSPFVLVLFDKVCQLLQRHGEGPFPISDSKIIHVGGYSVRRMTHEAIGRFDPNPCLFRQLLGQLLTSVGSLKVDGGNRSRGGSDPGKEFLIVFHKGIQ